MLESVKFLLVQKRFSENAMAFIEKLHSAQAVNQQGHLSEICFRIINNGPRVQG